MKNNSTWHTYHTVWLLTIITLFTLSTYSLVSTYFENNALILRNAVAEKKFSQTPTPTDSPKEKNENDYITENNIYYGELNGESFMKLAFTPYSEHVQYAWHSTGKPQESVILKSGSYQEPENVDYVSDTDIVWEPVVSSSITYKSYRGDTYALDDRLFSFRKIPNSSYLLFAMDWSAYSQLKNDLPDSSKKRRILYLYNTESKLTKTIKEFLSNEHEASYPIIKTVSPDSRYVEMKLYYCWNCGGHMPQTLLLDLTTLQTKNIGFVSYFNWMTEGAYEYKVHAVYECITPMMGGCSIPPEELKMQYGRFEL